MDMYLHINMIDVIFIYDFIHLIISIHIINLNIFMLLKFCICMDNVDLGKPIHQ